MESSPRHFLGRFGPLLLSPQAWKHVRAGGQCLLPLTLLSSRFAKLLLRLPALRSIGLKCLEHLFFFKLIGDTPIDTFLMEMLETPLQVT